MIAIRIVSRKHPDSKQFGVGMESDLRIQFIDLAKKFICNYEYYKTDSYNETELRNDYLNPFFKLLGWDIYNEKGLPPHLREVVHESVVYDEDSKKHPDYLFKTGTVPKFFLEAKKPAVHIENSQDSAFQARRYGWNGNHPISLLSNFKFTAIYDTTIIPKHGENANIARLRIYDIDDIESWIDEFYDVFSYQSVINGSLEKTFGSGKKKRQGVSFDDFFLTQIKRWRDLIAADIVSSNPSIRNDVLNLYVQKILNRVLFLRSCEDREFEDEETLKAIKNYDELKQLFLESDKKYDSGLFKFIDQLEFPISSEIVVDCFKDLYYPYSPYDFNIIDTFIIGQIYELFLVERLDNNDGSVSIIKTTDVVESRGVVKTPRMIVDAIISQLITSKSDTLYSDSFTDFHVLDICCGSGIFLLGAFDALCDARLQFLVESHLDDSLKNGAIIKNAGNSFILSYGEKRTILQNCIFGVDIDDLAVEVTKFSLQLELLRGTSRLDAESYCRINRLSVLPQLDNNIKVGNSLIDSSYRIFDPSVITDVNLMTRIKMFDWSKEFPFKFDLVIGNPPYVRVQKMNKLLDKEYNFFKDKNLGYRTASGTYDLYFLFIERALELITDNGEIGFIVSNRFLNIDAGKRLRDLLSSNRSIYKIIDFGTVSVFNDKQNYPCIVFLKNNSKSVEYSKVDDIPSFIHNLLNTTTVDISELNQEPWNFSDNGSRAIFDKFGGKISKLDSVCTISVGLQTSADQIYIIHPEYSDDNITKFYNLDKLYTIETSILRPFIHDTPLRKYHHVLPNAMIIYPYHEDNGKFKLFSENEMKDIYPQAWAYLNDFKDVLSKRSINGSNPVWYQYGRNQGFKLFNKPEILLWTVEALDANYVYDDSGVMFTGGGNGPYYGLFLNPETHESIFYIQAILNHPVTESIVRSIAPKIRGGYYSHGKEYIKSLPIYRIDFNNPRECAIHDSVVEKTRQMMNLSDKLDREQVSSIRDQIISSIGVISDEINNLLNNLYLDFGDIIDEEKE